MANSVLQHSVEIREMGTATLVSWLLETAALSGYRQENLFVSNQTEDNSITISAQE